MFSLAQVESESYHITYVSRVQIEKLTMSESHFTQDLSTQCGDGNSVIFVLMPMDSPVPMSRVLVSLQAKSPRNRIVHYLSLSTESRSLANIARDIYDRLPRQLRVVHPTEDQPTWYHYPSFTLAPAEPPKPHLTLQWPIKSFDVLGAWRWVHAAYAVDQITDSIVVFVADTEGDNWDVRVIQDAGIDWAGRIEAVWEFVTHFAAAAAIEWRVSISSLGCMDPTEVEGTSSAVYIDGKLTRHSMAESLHCWNRTDKCHHLRSCLSFSGRFIETETSPPKRTTGNHQRFNNQYH